MEYTEVWVGVTRCSALVTVVKRWPYWMILVCGLVQGQAPPTPRYAPVIDQANVLLPEEAVTLAAAVADIRDRTGASVAILIARSTLPEGIEAFSNRVANDWKLGGGANGIGVLIVVAVRDRTARIEVSRALEGALPDLAAKRILKETMSPHFAKGEYQLGLLQGVGRVGSIIQAEVSPTRPAAEGGWRRSTPVETALVGSLIVSILLGLWLSFSLAFRWTQTFLCLAAGSVLAILQVIAASAVGPGIAWGSGLVVAVAGTVLPWWFGRRSKTGKTTEVLAAHPKGRGKANSRRAGRSIPAEVSDGSGVDAHSNESSIGSDGSGGSVSNGDFAGAGASDKW